MKALPVPIVVWALLVPLISQLGVFVKADKVDVQKLIAFIQAYSNNGTEFTHSQLDQWYQKLNPEDDLFERYPRLFPFCVRLKQIQDKQRTGETAHIKKFEKIFDSLEKTPEKFYAFNETIHSTHFNKEWVKDIKLSRINTPELDMINLKQWLHLTVYTTNKVKGLYMQSIVGPMGLPFGEFNLEFPCADDPDASNLAVVGQLTHCTYRPRTTIMHPSAYVGFDDKGRDEWHTHFLWTDITCMETPYVQFLILVVKDFKEKGNAVYGEDYQPFFSPVYLNTDFDSRSGAPFPYYPEWEKQMYCFLDNATFESKYQSLYPDYPSKKVGADPLYAPLDWKISDVTYRIQPSESYDTCLTADNHKNRDEVRLECPPGPFRCTQSYSSNDTSGKSVEEQRVELVVKENQLKDCQPCYIPSCKELQFPNCNSSNITNTNILFQADRVETQERHGRVKVHGLLAILALSVFLPMSNFMGRFYKEVCGGCICNNGPWIFIHILLHLLGIVFTWLSLGPVTTEAGDIKKQCDQKFSKKLARAEYIACIKSETFENPHILLGTVAVAVQHLVIVFSFWRSSNNKLRNIQVALHSHFGDMTWLLGGIAGLLAYRTDCKDMMIINVIIFLLPLLFFGIGCALDLMTDKIVGIIPRRKLWPTLEPIKLEGRGPLSLIKWIVFAVYAFLQMIFWCLAVSSAYNTNMEIQDALVDTQLDLGPNKSSSNVIRKDGALYMVIHGLFSNCELEIKEGTLHEETNQTSTTLTTQSRDFFEDWYWY